MIKMNVLLIKHQQAAAAARLSNISERKFFSRLSRSACSSKTIFSVPFRGLSSASPRQHPFSRETKSDIILSVNTTPHDLDPQAVVSSRSARKPQALDTTLPSNNADPSCSPPLKDNPTSPEELQYTGNAVMPITSFLNIVKPQDDMPKGIWPVFRLMDTTGIFRDGKNDGFEWESATARTQTPKSLIPKELLVQDRLLSIYRQILQLVELDSCLSSCQRQGRISFYMTSHGEEAIHFGAASALSLQDPVFAQYREAGVLLHRNFSLQQFVDQCFSNKDDLGRGRQMPVHYGSRALNYQTISSPLGTQIPQAAGAAYKLKLQKKDAVAICFFGDGCASTTDFHSGLNFASTLRCPVLFFCRNNGYAISTKVTEQYSGDGIVSRAKGYGMAGIRVDGNDLFAVHAAVREARAYAIENSAPVLIEAMTYRVGHHSTSDDSLRYRSSEEVQLFKTQSDPLSRLQKFLQMNGMLSEEAITTMKDQEKMAVIGAMQQAEQKAKPSLEYMFSDVYQTLPSSLTQQEEALQAHLSKHPNKY